MGVRVQSSEFSVSSVERDLQPATIGFAPTRYREVVLTGLPRSV